VTAVLMIEDHAMFREGLMMTIGHLAPSLNIFPVSSGNEALAVLESRTDINRVIMDFYLPDVGGTALLKRLRQARPGLRILVLSASEDPQDRERALSAGARLFVHKSADSRTLLSALEQIRMPDLPCARPCCAPAAGERSERPDELALLSQLTPRQMDVLRLMCDGIRNREISAQLGVTEKTVKAHISVILATLNVPNRTQATMVARRGGLLGKPQ